MSAIGAGVSMIKDRRPYQAKHYSPDWQAVVDELRGYEQEGCLLYLSGRPSHPGEIAAACVREESGYMRDFLTDKEQQIRGINFVHIRGT